MDHGAGDVLRNKTSTVKKTMLNPILGLLVVSSREIPWQRF